MPTARGITVSLQSQYDALTIPEQILSANTAATRSTRISSLDLSSEQDYTSSAPQSSHSPIIDIKIPTFPCSQFWINYACAEPQGYCEDADVRFYYFKLFGGEECILSWGVGEQDDWCGKTMYALFSAGTDFDGKGIIEKRGLFFPKTGKRGSLNGFEIRVFRAKARKRESAKYQSVESVGIEQAGFDLTNIGRVKKGERRRMYTYGLIDPKDEPYITFRYTIQCDRESTETGTEPPRSPAQSTTDSSAELQQNASERTSLRRRLSVPPQQKLVPSSTRSEPMSPVKKVAFTDDIGNASATDFAEAKRRDWVVRTPSPMVSRLFDLPGASSSGQRKGITGGMLKSVVANALKKREEKER